MYLTAKNALPEAVVAESFEGLANYGRSEAFTSRSRRCCNVSEGENATRFSVDDYLANESSRSSQHNIMVVENDMYPLVSLYFASRQRFCEPVASGSCRKGFGPHGADGAKHFLIYFDGRR